MKVLVTIPIELQTNLLEKCEVKSPKFRMLKNGLIENDTDGRRVLKFLCETERIAEFIAWANQRCPDTAGQIVVDSVPKP